MGKEYGLHFFLLFKCRDIFFVLDDIIYDCSMYIWPPKWLNVYCHKLYNVCLIVLFILLSISFSSSIVGLFLRDAWKYPSRTVNLSIFSVISIRFHFVCLEVLWLGNSRCCFHGELHRSPLGQLTYWPFSFASLVWLRVSLRVFVSILTKKFNIINMFPS